MVVTDANGHPRCALEGVACTEFHYACNFAVWDILEMSPGSTNKEIHAVLLMANSTSQYYCAGSHQPS